MNKRRNDRIVRRFVTDRWRKRGVTPGRVSTIRAMTLLAVFTAVDGLIAIGLTARAVLGRGTTRVASSPDCSATAVSVDSTASSRTIHLSGADQSERAAALADPVEEIRQDFLADVSHELKTPVGAVALLAEAVLDAAEDPHQVRRFGSKILHEANRLSGLVTELIALSRLHNAERVPDLAIVDVDTVLRNALGRCQLSVESANMQITVDAPEGLLVAGDATSLVTALSNLIDNAVSYSPPNSPVSVSAQLANGFVEIAVADQGRGIAPEHQELVFERFFRVDQALSRSTGGTGLGLAIVKRVALNHGGDVQLRSALGAGSTFILRIPAPPGTHCTSRKSAGRCREADASVLPPPHNVGEVEFTAVPGLVRAQRGSSQ